MTINLSPAEQSWLMTLLLIWAGLLFGGFTFGTLNADESRRMPAWTRMASSLTLVVAGWSWWLFTSETDFHRLALLVAIGMTFGFVGDLFMAELIPLGDRVLGGIGAFGLGHVAYVAGLVHFGDTYGYDDPTSRWGDIGRLVGDWCSCMVCGRLPGCKRESLYSAYGCPALCAAAGRDNGICNRIGAANIAVHTIRNRRGIISAQ